MVASDNSLKQLQMPWRDRVELMARPAHITDGLPLGEFDTVVVNSVVQYFPNAGYLAEVIDNALDLLAPGGALFIGDVRNHNLQNAFQTAIALARGGETADAAVLRERIHHAVLGEPELLLAPEFFTALTAQNDQAAGVDVRVKRGVADNELNHYRYDVTIHKAPADVRSLATAPAWEWDHCDDVTGLHARLTSERPDVVRITGIPRTEVIASVRLEHALAAGSALTEADRKSVV